MMSLSGLKANMMMSMSPTGHSTTDFLSRVSILGETYDYYFAIACSFLQLIFTLQCQVNINK